MKFTTIDATATIGWRGTFAAKHDKVNKPAKQRDGYSVHNLYYRWQSQRLNNITVITVDVGIGSPADTKYQHVFAGAFAQGRNYHVQTSFQC